MLKALSVEGRLEKILTSLKNTLPSFNAQIWEIENYWITHEVEDPTSYRWACWKPHLIAY